MRKELGDQLPTKNIFECWQLIARAFALMGQFLNFYRA
jgi:hypothetical protein